MSGSNAEEGLPDAGVGSLSDAEAEPDVAAAVAKET